MSGFYGRKQIRKIVGGKSDSTIWRWERAGIFPKRQQLGPNTVGWKIEEVQAWVESRPPVGGGDVMDDHTCAPSSSRDTIARQIQDTVSVDGRKPTQREAQDMAQHWVLGAL